MLKAVTAFSRGEARYKACVLGRKTRETLGMTGLKGLLNTGGGLEREASALPSVAMVTGASDVLLLAALDGKGCSGKAPVWRAK